MGTISAISHATQLAPYSEAGAPQEKGQTSPVGSSLDSYMDGIEPRPFEIKQYVAKRDYFESERMLFPPFAEAGKPIAVTYDPKYLLDRDRKPVTDADGVKVRSRADGAKEWTTCELQKKANGSFAGAIDVPADANRELQVVVEVSRPGKPAVWDNNGAPGVDYRTPIVPQGGAVLRFDENWDESLVSGELKPGGALRILYDASRVLNHLKFSHYNGVMCDVNMLVQFDSREPVVVPLVRPKSAQAPVDTVVVPAIRIPEDASEVRISFVADSNIGPREVAWDSDFGRDYRFPVKR